MNPSRMRHTLPKQKQLGTVLATCAMLAVAANAFAEPVLKADAFKHHVEKFNAEENELYKNAIPNDKAWGFLVANIPLFECPDEEMERAYYFRWWTYRKHLRQSPEGWVVTEFLPQVPWSGKHNTISCPAGHHFHEGRWLADQTFFDQYATFWFQKGGNPRLYSFWAAEAIYSYWALASVYEVKDIIYDLPIMESWKKEGNRILLTFTKNSHPSSPYGMRVALKGFAIAGKDRHFYPAKLENEKGDTFAVTSEFVPEPEAVRYAWGVHPVGNFGNRAGPTPPFRTDDWPAWNDSPIERKGPETANPEVPTKESAQAQAKERKSAAARKFLEAGDVPQKKNKPEKQQ